ncbi:MAG: transposase, partial [Gammaproteobacteria bacterium]
MARLPRYFVPGQPLHIIQRGNNREPIFASDDDYRFYLDCLIDAADQRGLAVHAYVLMTNHVHLLATPDTDTSVGKTLQSVGRRYVQYFNHTYQRTGTLWEGRYKATLIDSEAYLLTCMRYIELNPARAGMVDHPPDYPWSSYARNARGAAQPLVTPHSLYRRLGRTDSERQSAYRKLFRAHLSQSDIDAIRTATNRAWVLGNDRFNAKIEKLSG